MLFCLLRVRSNLSCRVCHFWWTSALALRCLTLKRLVYKHSSLAFLTHTEPKLTILTDAFLPRNWWLQYGQKLTLSCNRDVHITTANIQNSHIPTLCQLRSQTAANSAEMDHMFRWLENLGRGRVSIVVVACDHPPPRPPWAESCIYIYIYILIYTSTYHWRTASD